MTAHRLTTVDNCDARIEVEHGSIVAASGKVDFDPGLTAVSSAIRLPRRSSLSVKAAWRKTLMYP